MFMQGQTEFLIKDIERSIGSFEKRKNGNKSKAFWMQIAVTAVSAISAVLLGIKWAGQEDNTRNIALILTSGVTVISAADSFFNHKKLWVNYNDTLTRLYALKFDMDFRLSTRKELSPVELKAYKDDYQAILDQTNEQWQKLHESPVKEEPKKH